jgi:hypothetical protein
MDGVGEIDPRLATIDRELIRALATHGPLLQWMRESLRTGYAAAQEIVSGLGEAQWYVMRTTWSAPRGADHVVRTTWC